MIQDNDPKEETPKDTGFTRSQDLVDSLGGGKGEEVLPNGLVEINLSSGTMLLTADFREVVGGIGLEQFEQQLHKIIQQILADPFGENSIDEFKDTDAGQWARLVHSADQLVPGLKLAIKGTGLDMQKSRDYLELGGLKRVTLSEQFRNSYRLCRAQQEHAPNGIGGKIFINKVHGLLTTMSEDGRLQEWMLMERIENGEPVQNIRVALSQGGVGLAFSRDLYPELGVIADPYDLSRGDVLLFDRLADEIGKKLGVGGRALADLNGNNILVQDDAEGERKFTIIDVGSAI